MTKHIYLEARKCLRRGWFARNPPEVVAPDEAAQFHIDEGVEVGVQARQLYPEGVAVEWTGLPGTVARTRRLMNDPNVSVIFEATFAIDAYITRADVLRRRDHGWKIGEVKSGLAKPEVEEEFLDDLCYTVMVASRCGVNVTGASLLQIDRAYRLGMPVEAMYCESDATEKVTQRMAAFSSRWTAARDGTDLPGPPPAMPCEAFSDCPYYDDQCFGRGTEYPVRNLTYLRRPRLVALLNAGMLDKRNVTGEFLAALNDRQRRIVQCVKSGTPYVSPGLRAELEAVRWPAYYLDFETVQTGLPLYPDVAPYTQLPTQFSVHRCSAPGVVDGHAEYLAADPARDCRRDFAERLIAELGTEGSIVVYSGFERRIIGEVAADLPDLAAALRPIRARLFDLLPVVRKHFYHPAFHGSFSIKAVLPALVPSMSYSGLAIADGGTAAVKFAKMAGGCYGTDECEVIRRDLLTYCERDTRAMVEVHRALLQQC
jgi:hypothetical protein